MIDQPTTETPAPNAFIQWKGTKVCLDLRCLCGKLGHFDGYFAYAIRCPACDRVYPMPTTIALTEGDPGNRIVVTAEVDD